MARREAEHFEGFADDQWPELWAAQHNAETWRTSASGMYEDRKEKVMSQAFSPESTAMKPHETPDNPSIARPLDQYYDKAEVFAALRDLSKEEINQMQSFARFRLMGKTWRPGYVEVEDLFIDAASRTMEQKRS